MSVERLDVPGYDEVFRVDCAGATAFVALHAVLDGHAFGGIRIQEQDDEAAALADALRLARAMTRKVVLADLPGGGGKCVLVAPPAERRAACVAALGAFIESLGGRWCCGPDMGFTAADDAALRTTTGFVACGGMSAATATSVRTALQTACPEARRVAIQGLGAVGRPLADQLVAAGLEVVATDADPRRAAGLASVPPEAIYDVDADVFAPCAGGSVLDHRTIPRLRCRLVCGGANNPTATAADVERLAARGIEVVPDFVANSGATIVGVSTHLGQIAAIAGRLVAVGPRTRELLGRARERGCSAQTVAEELADERLAARRAAAAR